MEKFAMNKKKLGGGGLLVVQAAPKDKCSQIWVAVEWKLIQRVLSLSQLNTTKNVYGTWPWPHVDPSLSLPRCRQEFPWMAVDLQVPDHLWKEIIKCSLPSVLLELRFAFPLVNESWEGWQLWERGANRGVGNVEELCKGGDWRH